MAANPKTQDSTPPLVPAAFLLPATGSLEIDTNSGMTDQAAESRKPSSAATPGCDSYGLPSIATATLAELKAFHAIFSRNRNNQQKDLDELNTRGLTPMAPQALEVQFRHLRVITTFCKRLEERIAACEKLGQVEGIEVIDLTQEEEEEASTPLRRNRRQPHDPLAPQPSRLALKQTRTTAQTPVRPGSLVRTHPLARKSASDSSDDVCGGEDVLFHSPSSPESGKHAALPSKPASPALAASPSNPTSPVPASPPSKPASPARAAPPSKPASPAAAPPSNSASPAPAAPPSKSASPAPAVPPSKPASPAPAPPEADSPASVHPTMPTAPPADSPALDTSAVGAPRHLPNKPAEALGAAPPLSGAPAEDAMEIDSQPVLPPSKAAGKDNADSVLATILPASSAKDTGPAAPTAGSAPEAAISAAPHPDPALNLPTSLSQPATKAQPDAASRDSSLTPEPDANDAMNLDDAPDPTPAPQTESTKEKGKSSKSKSKKGKDPNAKRTRRGKKDMTEEEKKEAERKAAERKKARLGSSYLEVPQPGVFMEKVWSRDRCAAAHDTHNQMQKDARNPKWDYGPPLLTLVREMVDWGQRDTFPRECYLEDKLFSASPEAVLAFKVILESDFQLCLRQCPALIQVAANDPFFDRDVIRLELIKQARESDNEVKAASWKILYQMMMRTDSTSKYTEDKETRSLFSSAFRKLHTLAESAYKQFHHFIPMPRPKQTPNTDTILLAGTFVISKIRTLEACAISSLPPSDEPLNPPNAAAGPVKPPRKSNTPNGLLFLQKRVWETVLCCLMMVHSKCKANLAASKSKDSNSTRLEKELMKFDHNRSLYDTGDLSTTASRNDIKRWSKMRLSAFGSMAVFFLYGAAGWWHGLTDSHNYNKQDVWALVHLAHAKHEWLYKLGHCGKRRQEDTPWYCLDSFVRWLLVECGFWSEEPEEENYGFIPQFLSTEVSELRLSQFALHDILHEVCRTGTSKSANYNGFPAPDVNLSREDCATADRLRSHISSKWHATVLDFETEGHATNDDPKIHSNSSSPNPASRPTTKNNTPLKGGRKLIAVVVPAEQVRETKKTRVDLGEADAKADQDELDADVSSSDEE
ncbi:hypothetical protein PtA15_2A949 [Puccinia triticina]|uniref:Golgi to ER traffic-protein n=1 Tax=Puccinia triticina TaxID=208348 RepID=A0ABY7CIK0_9BASI|nr:uncharacterized protein PtA15_2A949 [Puccinia triticina]WAQ82632.1 hypothetical protein PtA15_2A949 [Puccinia triticina]